MNNNNTAFLRSLIVYSICLPVAVVVGYWTVSAVSAPGRSNLILMGCVALALTIPILLRWHHPLLALCWNLPASIFFLPGNASLGMAMIGVSLGISLLQRATNRNMHFIRAPQITLPLCVLIGVALLTAKFTGGIGLHSMGSETGGGKRYIGLFTGLLGYFAFTARRIPPQKIGLYLALFFLPLCVNVLSDLANYMPSPFSYIYYVIPASSYMSGGRFSGIGATASAIFTFMLVRYGIRKIFLSGKPWRVVVLMLAFAGMLFGGFRSAVITTAMVFAIQFFLEGLHRTKLLPIFLFFGIFAAVICVPLANKLPYAVQRTLAILPLINIDPMIKMEADGSTDWRLAMWKALLPQVPQHLWLGKGYAISQEDWEVVSHVMSFSAADASGQALALSGDYHSGPLSVILPLGIWGCIGVIWLFSAGVWALHCNYRYGEPRLKTVNVALFALFITHIVSFLFIFGDLPNDVIAFSGYLGLSICLNGGICRKTAPAIAEPPSSAPRFPTRPFQPAFSK